MHGGTTSPNHIGASGFHVKSESVSGSGVDPQDEKIDMLQQPLAVGYYVSTAPTGPPLPEWFCNGNPFKQTQSPSCFKVRTALLVKCLRVHVRVSF